MLGYCTAFHYTVAAHTGRLSRRSSEPGKGTKALRTLAPPSESNGGERDGPGCAQRARHQPAVPCGAPHPGQGLRPDVLEGALLRRLRRRTGGPSRGAARGGGLLRLPEPDHALPLPAAQDAPNPAGQGDCGRGAPRGSKLSGSGAWREGSLINACRPPQFIKNEEFKYVRLLGAFYMRMVGRPLDVYQYLEACVRLLSSGVCSTSLSAHAHPCSTQRSPCTTTTGGCGCARQLVGSR